MSIITDALKLASTQEKLIAKQEAEIAALKAKVESLTIAKAAADEAARLASVALKEAEKKAKADLKEAKRVGNEACNVVQQELISVRRQLKEAQKPVKAVVPTNDALGQVKRRPGRPKKSATPEVTSEVMALTPEVTPEVDPRQLNIPDLGAPAPGVSVKGNTYEFV